MKALNSDIVKDETIRSDTLLIVQKYENFLDYIYPIVQSIPRTHGVFKAGFLTRLFDFVDYIYEAGKSNQVSKLYIADSCLASIRFRLRFMVHAKRRMLTPKQWKTCQAFLSEVGKIIGSWIKKHKK